MWRRAAAASASPLAWPTVIAVRAFTWNRIRSTATPMGARSSNSASRSTWSWASRSGSGASGGVRSTPNATGTMRWPSRRTAPYPHRDSPGSIPNTTPKSRGSNTSSILGGIRRRLADLEGHPQCRSEAGLVLPHLDEADRLVERTGVRVGRDVDADGAGRTCPRRRLRDQPAADALPHRVGIDEEVVEVDGSVRPETERREAEDPPVVHGHERAAVVEGIAGQLERVGMREQRVAIACIRQRRSPVQVAER